MCLWSITRRKCLRIIEDRFATKAVPFCFFRSIAQLIPTSVVDDPQLSFGKSFPVQCY
jgi:hypothetical protein